MLGGCAVEAQAQDNYSVVVVEVGIDGLDEDRSVMIIGLTAVGVFIWLIYRLMLAGSVTGRAAPGRVLVRVLVAFVGLVVALQIVSALISGDAPIEVREFLLRCWPGGSVAWKLMNSSVFTLYDTASDLVKLILILPLKMFIPPTLFAFGKRTMRHRANGGLGRVLLPLNCIWIGFCDVALTMLFGSLLGLVSNVFLTNLTKALPEPIALILVYGVGGVLLIGFLLTTRFLLKGKARDYGFRGALYCMQVLLGLFALMAWTSGRALGATVTLLCFAASGIWTLVTENEHLNSMGGGLFWKK